MMSSVVTGNHQMAMDDKLSPRLSGEDQDFNQMKSPLTMVKMSKKILELRNEKIEQIHINDQRENL